MRILTGDTLSGAPYYLSDGVYLRAEDDEREGVPRLFPPSLLSKQKPNPTVAAAEWRS